MNPSLNQVHNINEPLTDFSAMLLQQDSGFIADKVFPVRPVNHQASSYYFYPQATFNFPLVQERAPGAEVTYGDYEVTTQTYSTKVWAVGKQIDDQIRANADSAISLDIEATMWLNLQMLLRKELLWTSAFFQSGVWTTNFTGVGSSPSTNQFLQWNNSNSTPIENIRTMKRQVMLASGNTTGSNNFKLVLGKQVYDTLVDHPEIVNRVNFSVKQQGEAALVTKNVLAQLFEVDEILVMESVENTAQLGQNQVNVFIGGSSKAALLAYVNPMVGLRSPTAGLNFTWSAYGPSRVTSYYWQPTRATRIDMESAFQYSLVSPDLAGFFASAIA